MPSFGIGIPVSGSRYPLGSLAPDFPTIRKMAEVAEEMGFDSVWIPDHVMNAIGSTAKVGRIQYAILPSLEGWTTLSSLSQVTTRARLSNIVLCNLFRHPSLLAKMASTLDVISGGRFTLGLGAGWFKLECLSYGLPWYPYNERVERLREAIKVIKALWTEKVANYQGRYYSVRNAYLEPKPLQKPHPPIWIGGASVNMMRIAAELADGWDAGGNSPDELRAKLDALKGLCSEIGRGSNRPSVTQSCSAVYADNFEKGSERVKTMAELGGVALEKFAARQLIGTTGEMINQAEKLFDAGADRLILWFEPRVEEVRRFGKEVLPSFL